MEKEKLHKLIQLYFDGETSLEEERSLLAQLLSMPPGDALADEALAVMGFARCGNTGKKRKSTVSRHGIYKTTSVAAACVASAAVCVGLFAYFSRPVNSFYNEECVAYVGGEKIENESEVMSLISDQLDEMSVASDAVEKEINDDLNDIREIMDFD